MFLKILVKYLCILILFVLIFYLLNDTIYAVEESKLLIKIFNRSFLKHLLGNTNEITNMTYFFLKNNQGNYFIPSGVVDISKNNFFPKGDCLEFFKSDFKHSYEFKKILYNNSDIKTDYIINKIKWYLALYKNISIDIINVEEVIALLEEEYLKVNSINHILTDKERYIKYWLEIILKSDKVQFVNLKNIDINEEHITSKIKESEFYFKKYILQNENRPLIEEIEQFKEKNIDELDTSFLLNKNNKNNIINNKSYIINNVGTKKKLLINDIKEKKLVTNSLLEFFKK